MAILVLLDLGRRGRGVLVSEREVKWIRVLMGGDDVAIFEACLSADGL